MTQMILADDPCRYQKGVTLVELAVVLVVVALLLAGLLGPLSTRVEQQQRQRTEGVLEDIKETFYGFAVANGRLPCPDTDPIPDGTENPLGGVGGCAGVGGVLPWVTLGMPQQDSWGTNFVYRVTGVFADNTDGTNCGLAPEPPPTVGVSFKLCSAGDIVVRDAAPGGNIVSSNVPAIVISCGSNRNQAALAINGDLSNHENENINNDINFVSKGFSRDDAQEFDDLVVWISPYILKNRMVAAGRLP